MFWTPSASLPRSDLHISALQVGDRFTWPYAPPWLVVVRRVTEAGVVWVQVNDDPGPVPLGHLFQLANGWVYTPVDPTADPNVG
jgi:hypothetical protein